MVSSVVSELCCISAALLIEASEVVMALELVLNDPDDVVYAVTELEIDATSDVKDVDELWIATVTDEVLTLVELTLLDEVASTPSDEASEERLSDALARRSSTLEDERE